MSGLAQSARLRDRPERRYVVGGYSIWIHGSATQNETRKLIMRLLFLRASAAQISRRISVGRNSDAPKQKKQSKHYQFRETLGQAKPSRGVDFR